MTKTILVTVLALGAFACGDNKKQPDAVEHIDGAVDAPGVPQPPTLGPQIDRMGRPAVNTALNHAFDTDATAKGSAKDAYNADEAVGQWPTTYAAQFAANLAILDALDQGLLSGTMGAGSACGNQALYNGQLGGGGTATATSYSALAGVLGDDELYLYTATGTCQGYLAVEFAYLQSQTPADCGGRAPPEDVMDTSYSLLAAGIAGFNLSTTPPTPLFGDTVGAHTDLTTTFPYFGAPHS
ncbi:MAG TPA: hypothetical protein VLX92_03925 [Kofleriaceae bacterium]|nr:hypothetical protein [Kofleriaceae bacterium]